MPPSSTSEIDTLAAPKDDGQVLICPDRHRLRTLAERNNELLAASPAKILDRTIGDCRRSLPKYQVLTGHQPSFFHAGVWAKNVAAADLAAALGGSAGFLV